MAMLMKFDNHIPGALCSWMDRCRRFLPVEQTGKAALESVYSKLDRLTDQANKQIEELSLKLTLEPNVSTTSGSDMFFICDHFWSLVVQRTGRTISFYLIPTENLITRDEPCVGVIPRIQLKCRRKSGSIFFTFNGNDIAGSDLDTLLASLLNDLIKHSTRERNGQGEEIRLRPNEASLTTLVRRLMSDRQLLIENLIVNEDRLKNELAAELHDEIMGELLILARSQRLLGDESLASSIESVVNRIRSICHTVSCREVNDWGLKVALEDLTERLSLVVGPDCKLRFDWNTAGDFNLSDEAELQIYRIIQGSLSNAIRHAHATQVILRVRGTGDQIQFSIIDNGARILRLTGQRMQGSGMGISILRERTELLCGMGYRAVLEFAVGASKGTAVELKISARQSKAG